MKKRAVIIAALVSIFVLGAASAALATSSSGYVFTYDINAELHTLTFTLAGFNPCDYGTGHWLINTDTFEGQTMANAVIAAYQSGKTIRVVGSGVCIPGGKLELVVDISQ